MEEAEIKFLQDQRNEREEREKKFILFSQIKYRENNIITSIFNYNITFKQNYIADRI